MNAPPDERLAATWPKSGKDPIVKILIFGAAGRTGRQLVTQGLASGDSVTAFVRDPAKLNIEHESLTTVVGDVADPSAVESAVVGHDAVLCALGAATPLSRNPTLVDGIRHLVRAMQQDRVQRLVYLSFVGVGDGRRQIGWFGRTVISSVVLRNVVADHAEKERIVRDSTLQWTIVRPPRLTTRPGTGRFRSGENIKATNARPTLSREDLAAFMLQVVHEGQFVRQAPALLP